MALPGVYITDSDGNIGTTLKSESDVCGMLFNFSGASLPADFLSPPSVLADLITQSKAIKFTSVADLDKYGLKPYGEKDAFMGGIPYYHIKQFFDLRGGSGRLYVMFSNNASNFYDIRHMQKQAHGMIYQIGVWSGQTLFTGTGKLALNPVLVPELQSQAYAMANEDNAPASILLYATPSSTDSDGGIETDVERWPSLKGDNRYVSVMLGQANTEEVRGMQHILGDAGGKGIVGAMGADLAMLSKNSVPTCIGYVGGCDYSGYVPNISLANDYPYEWLATYELQTMHEKGYNFFMQYAGDETGVYRNFDHTCTDGDYRTIARNRVMNKARRLVRAALLPMVNRTVLIDPATGYLTSASQAIFINAVNTVLDAMVTAGEISAHSTPVLDQTDSILRTDAVYISYSIVPLGVASEIYVTQSLSITA